MLVVLPYFLGDKPQAVRLANLIRDLGGVKRHDCLLVIDTSTDESGVIEPLREAFNKVSIVPSLPVGPQGTWGNGTTDASAANEMWLTGANTVFHRHKVPFVWMETDACPTRATWLDEIESEYLSCGKAFMGAFVNIPPHEPHMSGIACYPFDVANHSTAMMMPGRTAWDYAGRDDTVRRGRAHFTKLIQHEYRIHGESPSFPTPESLNVIRPETAVFHRCKDGTLIDRLREKMGVSTKSEEIATPSAQVKSLPPPPSEQNEAEEVKAPKTLAEQIQSMAKSLARIAASRPERAQMVKDALVSENIMRLLPKLSPEHLEKLRAGRDKARARKAKKPSRA